MIVKWTIHLVTWFLIPVHLAPFCPKNQFTLVNIQLHTFVFQGKE